MRFDSKVEGVYNLDKVFSNLPESTRRKALMPALRKGGAVIRKAAAQNVSRVVSNEATGLLSRSIRVYNSKSRSGELGVIIQVQRGTVNAKKLVNGKPVRVGLYAGVLEYGKEGQPPRSWIRAAADQKESEAINVVTSEINSRMVQAVRDAGGK